MKKIALFGGSFNPPHPGHFEMAQYVYDALEADEVWFLFSVSPQKDPLRYAPTADRIRMGEILAQHYPDMTFRMSNIQEELGTYITYETLEKLGHIFPDNRFIWVMGADNLATFHTWHHWEDIIKKFLIAVVDRSPYTDAALNGPAALKFQFLRATSPKNLAGADRGWCFLENPQIDISSSNLLERLRSGETQFDGPFQEVADYIRKKKLYGISDCVLRHGCEDKNDFRQG